MLYKKHVALHSTEPLARRASAALIEKQALQINSEPHIAGILHAISLPVIIINASRQVVFANSPFLSMLGLDSDKPLLGVRPGEIISCLHSTETEHGCGTSAACALCGAIEAVLEAQSSGKKTQREARISSHIQEQLVAFDFQITATPYTINQDVFYIVSLKDISAEKRKEALSRIFLHDTIGPIGAISGFFELYTQGRPIEIEEIQLFSSHLKSIVGQLKLFQTIMQAEHGQLDSKSELLNSLELLKETAEFFEKVYPGSKVLVKNTAMTNELYLYTDPTLLTQVLHNLIRNAEEATREKGQITLTVENQEKAMIFSVHSETYIPDNIKLQIFNRSFSTKGTNRGTGTYSVKLLTENYLHGKAWFTSTEKDGTTFYIELPKN